MEQGPCNLPTHGAGDSFGLRPLPPAADRVSAAIGLFCLLLAGAILGCDDVTDLGGDSGAAGLMAGDDGLAVVARGDPEVDAILSRRLAFESEARRLGVRPPRNDNQRRAAELIEEARLAVRSEDLPTALALLRRAEATAPGYVVVFSELANVAYLNGDVDVAIRALRRGLALEPENAVLRNNLERLESEPPRLRRRNP